MSPKRISELPDVPAVAETIPGFEVNLWWGFFVPAGTPKPIVERLNKEILAALNAPDVRQRLAPQGFNFVSGTPEQLREYMKAETAKWDNVIKKAGIKVLTATKVTSAKPGANGVTLTAEPAAGGASQTIEAEYLLVATGRGPVTTGLGAAEAGLKLERGYIKVDELYRTSVPNVSALGDVITLGSGAHPQLAHVSSMEGIIVAERISGREVRPLNYDHVPSCTYCDPEIGSVGLTEAEAKQRGHDVRIGTFPFGVLGRAKMAGETEGFVKIVAGKQYDEVLGVHMIGPRSTELVGEATLALRLECTVEELIRTIHAHPTMSEAIGEAAHAAHGAPIHA